MHSYHSKHIEVDLDYTCLHDALILKKKKKKCNYYYAKRTVHTSFSVFNQITMVINVYILY